MSKSSATLALIAVLVSVPAVAKDTPAIEGASRVVDELTACRKVMADAERLACFDRTAAAFETARSEKQLAVIDREDVKRTKKSLFGLSLPRINLFGGKDDEDDVEEIKEITSVVRAVRARPYGMFSITLSDGSAWSFTDPLFDVPVAGDGITIRRAALGSFKGSVKGRIAVRIKRDR